MEHHGCQVETLQRLGCFNVRSVVVWYFRSMVKTWGRYRLLRDLELLNWELGMVAIFVSYKYL